MENNIRGEAQPVNEFGHHGITPLPCRVEFGIDSDDESI
jgi:hypothetical protein